ncbi:MAG: hypothetical protein ACLFPF_02050 [Halanaerobiales bacterium]
MKMIKNNVLLNILFFLIAIIFSTNSFIYANEGLSDQNNSAVIINAYYSKPQSLNDTDTIVLKGVSSGEYLEVIVKGVIYNFRHISLSWNNAENALVEKEVIHKINTVTNQTIIINTYLAEGIPQEKIQWEDHEGKPYEFIIQEDGK